MNKILTILCIEDNKDDIFLTKKVLKRAGIIFKFDWVSDKYEFIEAITKNIYDIIISDHMIDQFGCSEAFEICKTRNIQTPFILLSGIVNEDIATSLLNDGVKEYIKKSNISALPESIKKHIDLK